VAAWRSTYQQSYSTSRPVIVPGWVIVFGVHTKSGIFTKSPRPTHPPVLGGTRN